LLVEENRRELSTKRMTRTSYDPVLEANRPESGGFFPALGDVLGAQFLTPARILSRPAGPEAQDIYHELTRTAEMWQDPEVPRSMVYERIYPELGMMRSLREEKPYSREWWRAAIPLGIEAITAGGGAGFGLGSILGERYMMRPTAQRAGAINQITEQVKALNQQLADTADKIQPPKVWETNLYDRKYSGPPGTQEWADLYATPDMEFTAGAPRNLKPFDPEAFKAAFPPTEPYSQLPPVPSDPFEAAEYWKFFERGGLPGQGGKAPLQYPMEFEKWKYAERPGELIGGGYHSDEPLLENFSHVPPPYGYQSPLKITPGESAGATPPGITITPAPPSAPPPSPPSNRLTPWEGLDLKPETPPNDPFWWYKQPEPPYLSYVEPQMRFYPQTDWMQQLYQSQLYPDELNWRLA
jgi:hypothetical protein